MQQRPFLKIDIFLIGAFICINFLIQQNAMNWTVYNLYSLGLSMYFMVKALRFLASKQNSLFVLSNWLLSACIGMAMVDSYIDFNEALKLCSLILAFGNAFFIYKFSRIDQGRAFGLHLLVMAIISMWVI